MGYFNGVASAYFKKGSDGKAVFLRYRVYGQGQDEVSGPWGKAGALNLRRRTA